MILCLAVFDERRNYFCRAYFLLIKIEFICLEEGFACRLLWDRPLRSVPAVEGSEHGGSEEWPDFRGERKKCLPDHVLSAGLEPWFARNRACCCVVNDIGKKFGTPLDAQGASGAR